MNPHVYAALIGALLVTAFLALVLWEVREYNLAKREAGKPCKHGKAKGKCPACRRKFSLFSLFGHGDNQPDVAQPEDRAESDPDDAPPAHEDHKSS